MTKLFQYLFLNTLLLCSNSALATSLIPYFSVQKNLNSRSTASDPSLSPDSLSTTVSCKWRCKAEPEYQGDELHYLFSAEDLGLRDGNGRLLTPLTNTLKFWSEDICLNAGAKSCGSLKNLEEFKVVSLSSGRWFAPALNFTCDEKQEYILSPFSPELEYTLSRVPAESWIPSHTLSEWEIPFDGSLYPDKSDISTNSCQYPIQATFCFGDCVYVEGKGISQFLATPKPLGKSLNTICLDDLAGNLKEQNYSADVLRHACESYAFKILKQNKSTGMTCSSSRLTANCHPFIDKLLYLNK